jgi:hypothetical protein
MLFFLAFVALLPHALGTGSTAHSRSSADLLQALSSSRPQGVDPAFDCGWRILAFEYASVLQPWLSSAALSELYDALEIKAFGCNASGAVGARGGAAAEPNDARNAAAAPTAGGTAIYVDYAAGSDSADGSVAHPLKTVVAAVAASRGLAPGARPARVVLRNGTHYLNATISLGAADSGLRFEAFPGEAPVLSGALPLRALVWVQKNVTAAAPPGGPVQPNENNVFGECGRPGVPNKGVMADWQACQASCLADSTCTSWTYHNGTFNPGFTHVCWWVFGRLFSSAL